MGVASGSNSPGEGQLRQRPVPLAGDAQQLEQEGAKPCIPGRLADFGLEQA